MAKVSFNQLELSDIKKVVEEVLDNKLKTIVPFKKEKDLTLLTRKQASDILCVSLPTLHSWTKSGIIKAYRIGSRVLYRKDEIKEALRQVNTERMRGGDNA